MTPRAHILLLLASACATSSGTLTAPPAPPVNWAAIEIKTDARASTIIDKERQAATLYFKALEGPGLPKLGPVLDELAYFQCGLNEARGRQRVIDAHQAMLGSLDERSFVVSRSWITNDDKALEWTLTATLQGKPISLSGLTLLTTNDDALITDVHMYVAGPTAVPSGERRVFEQDGSPRETKNVALMRTFVQALEDNKESEFLALVVDREDARSYFKAIRRAIGQLDIVVENAWGVQDFVIIEYSMNGRQLAPLPRIPLVKNRILRVGIVEVGEVHAGKITRVWRFDAPDALPMEARVEK